MVGANANTTANAEGPINQFVAQAESFINVATRNNYSDSYTTLNVDTRDLLKEVAGARAAILVINYDLNAFPSLLEAQSRMDVLRDFVVQGMKLLVEMPQNRFLQDS